MSSSSSSVRRRSRGHGRPRAYRRPSGRGRPCRLVPALLRAEVEGAPVLPRAGRERVGALHPLDEARGGRAHRELGVDVDEPCEVDDREEKVADLGEDRGVWLGLGRGAPGAHHLLGELVELLAHLGERPLEPGPVIPGRSSPALHLPGVQEARKRQGHVVEDPLTPLLLRLDRLPALAHPPCGRGLGVAEHVRMTPHELRVDTASDGLEIPLALLLEEQGEEVRLEEQVTELVDELGRVVRERRLGDLVGLLDRVRDDRPRRLLAIPGALRPQATGQLLELEERAPEGVGTEIVSRRCSCPSPRQEERSPWCT